MRLKIENFSTFQFNPECNNVLGVFGLSLYTNEKDVKEIFEKYGKVNEVQVVYDHNVSYHHLCAMKSIGILPTDSSFSWFCFCVL